MYVTLATRRDLAGHDLEVGEAVKIKFNYNENLVEQIKILKGRKYDECGKYWVAPITKYCLRKLSDLKFEIDPILNNWGRNAYHIPGFEKLYSFQKEGVQFIEDRGGSGLIGDPMGLGKTMQALGYLGLHPETRPALIIMPATIKIKWAKEIEKWMPSERIQIISGKKEVEITGSIVLANWDVIFYSEKIEIKGSDKVKIKYFARKDLLKAKFKSIIGDEIHKINNSKAARTVAFKKLAKRCPSVIALSGTPIKNRPKDFFNILNILDPTNFKSYWNYAHRYCGAKHNGFGWDFNGSSNIKELHELVQTIMIRRKKEDVTDLPPKTRIVIPLELTNAKAYRDVEKRLKELAKSRNAPPAMQLTMIETLKQAAVEAKLKACIDWIKEYLEVENKLVVFCVHKKVVISLQEALKKYNPLTIVGGVSAEEKYRRQELFQNDPKHRIVIGNMPAASEGLDLFAASATFTIELMWGPTVHDQSEDRVHRIGQKSSHCFAYYGLGIGTIDEKIALLIDQKRKILDKTIDGEKTERESMLLSLMKTYSEKN